MGHTWRAQIYHTNKTDYLQFADGDDVTVTAGIALAGPPRTSPETNNPFMAVLTINNSWAVPARNVLHSSFNLWSSGSTTGAVARGMFVRTYYRDSITGSEVRLFQGRIKSIQDNGDGTVTLTCYNELMILGEFRDPYICFSNARDRMGDNTYAYGPDLTCSIDADGRLIATLPDSNISTPLMMIKTMELTEHFPEFMNLSADSGRYLNAWVAVRAPAEIFHHMKAVINNPNNTNSRQVRAQVCTVKYEGGLWKPDAVLAQSNLVTIAPGVTVTVTFSTTYLKLEKDRIYLFGLTNVDYDLIWKGSLDEAAPEQLYTVRQNDLGYSNYTDLPLLFSLYFLDEMEIDSSEYALSGNALTVIPKKPISSDDITEYNKRLRLTYYYSSKTVGAMMVELAQRAGFTAALASGVTSSMTLGFYNTSTYSYLECMRELSDLYDPIQGRQLTFQAVMSGALDDKILRIGQRRKPWADGPAGPLFTDDPMTAEDVASSVFKRIAAGAALRRAFEGKIGTQRMIGRAFDGDPISKEIDDLLWADSLVTATGSPLMDISMDDTLSSDEVLITATEAAVRAQHHNEVEGSVPLNGYFSSLWEQGDNASFGQGSLIRLTMTRSSLVAKQVQARRMTLEARQTVMDLDNDRVQDVTMIRRDMEKARQGQSFNISSMPDTVYIFPRAASIGSYGSYDRVRVTRADAQAWNTKDHAGTAIKVSEDSCDEDGQGYVHFQGFFRGGLGANSPTSYKYSGGAASIQAITKVAVGDGTNWTEVTLDRPYYVWSHQNLLVDLRAPR